MVLVAFLRVRCERTVPNVAVGIVSAPGAHINGSQAMTEHPTLWGYYKQVLKTAQKSEGRHLAKSAGSKMTSSLVGAGILAFANGSDEAMTTSRVTWITAGVVLLLG